MSTIILYKNNKSLRLPLLKFISNKKRYRIDTPPKLKPIKNIKENKKEIKNEIKHEIKKEKPNISALVDLPTNSEKFILNKSKEEGVQTIQTSFHKGDYLLVKRHSLNNIFNNNRTMNKDLIMNEYDSAIENEKVYRLGNKNKKKLLENYSQLNYYFNNVNNPSKENFRTKFFKLSKVNSSQKLFESRINKFRNIENNKINSNKTQEKTDEKIKEKLENLFHNELLVNNINKSKKLRIKKENFKNDFNLIKSNNRYKSLPNIFVNLNKKVILKVNKSRLMKSNRRILPANMNYKRQNFLL
jgi:hypothetical protein